MEEKLYKLHQIRTIKKKDAVDHIILCFILTGLMQVGYGLSGHLKKGHTFYNKLIVCISFLNLKSVAISLHLV